LLQTVYHGRWKEGVLKLLSLEKINPNITFTTNPEDKETLFHAACRDGDVEIVKALLSRKDTELNPKGRCNVTPFYLACCEGRTEIVKLLLDSEKVNINQDKEGEVDPLEGACYAEQLPVIKLLLECQHFKPKDAFKKAVEYKKYNVFAYYLHHKRIPIPKKTDPKLESALEAIVSQPHLGSFIENLLGATAFKPALKKPMEELLFKIIDKRRSEGLYVNKICIEAAENFRKNQNETAYQYAKKHYPESIEEQEKLRAIHLLHTTEHLAIIESPNKEDVKLNNAIAYFRFLEDLPAEMIELMLETQLRTGREFTEAFTRYRTDKAARALTETNFFNND
jgi:hypothetical protein